MTSTISRHYFETQLPLAVDALTAATRLARSGLFESYVVYETGGAFSYAGGVRAELTLDRTGAELSQEGAEKVSLPWDGAPLRQISSLLDTVAIPGWRAYGWATFELSYAKDGDLTHVSDNRLVHLVVPAAEVRIIEGAAHLRAADQATLTALITAITAAVDAPVAAPTPLAVRGRGVEQYQGSVQNAVDSIAAGNLDKVILSRVVDVDFDVDLAGTYQVGRKGNNPARSFLLNLGGLEALGFSPEIVVQVDAAGRVVSQPLAGTRALTDDEAVNAQLRSDLFGSAKEVYEHAISVKVGTDELTDVCVPGSIEVPEFMVVKSRGTCQHLASKVAGQLAPGFGPWDAFGAVFPAVTASGVPKAPAYDAIRGFEAESRGLYSGAVLTVDQSGEMDAALVLRSAYRQDGRTWLRAGAGIVAASSPEREYEETSEKMDSVARYLVPATDPADTPARGGR
ncbi:salicylate synthase [Actinokineospora pegani]|uniref:salicylate synthase n=1 Tax=Actinokineospora pegani TaxID=2654637 RepID=UPI0012EA4E02|nr:salicylate synthase [Actinokineospora pegani]